MSKNTIMIETMVHKSMNQVWEIWTKPMHIVVWYTASEDWYTPSAENDLRVGGSFSYTMAARDGSFSFDFLGSYDEVSFGKRIAYTIGDGRKVVIEFMEQNKAVKIIVSFEAEITNSIERQSTGWQAILDNFKRYTEQL